MTKHEREIRQDIKAAGFKVLGLDYGKHLRFTVQMPDGTTKVVIEALSPSDNRARKNRLARLKKWSRQAEVPTNGVAQ